VIKLLYINKLRDALEELLKNDEKVYIIGEDIAEPYGGAFKVTKGLSNKYPNKFIQTPMSEQGFTGMGIGMALDGLKPIVEIMFGDFITLTVDQIVNHLVKFHQMYNKKMNFVLRTTPGGYRGYGATHSQSLETLFLNIPGIEIISPSILNEPGYLLKKSINYGIPILFIENKLDYSQDVIEEKLYKDIINIEEYNDKIWPVKITNIVGEEPEITLITHGGMTKYLIELQEEIFIEEEIPIEIISLSNIKNIDFNKLKDHINSKSILLIEESYEKFGWGSYILSELVKKEQFIRYDNLGAKLSFIPASKSLEDYILPTKQKIGNKILKMLGDQK